MNKPLKVAVCYEIEDWKAPTVVWKVQHDSVEDNDNAISTKELTEDMLEELCERFKRDVFKKAGKYYEPLRQAEE